MKVFEMMDFIACGSFFFLGGAFMLMLNSGDNKLSRLIGSFFDIAGVLFVLWLFFGEAI